MKKLSTPQLILLSTGGMIGCGWLFSPYYGFQTAGVGVVLSWLIVSIMTFIIGLSFAEVATILPIVGGISRYMGITHNRHVSFVFLALGWLSYVVYLPLEIQSSVQYLGFWFHNLVINNGTATTLSYQGLSLALIIMLGLTWFNTLVIGKIAKVNTVISLWKIIIPLLIAWGLIIAFGDWHNVNSAITSHSFSFESVLLAITSSGLAFAFTGFQNGLILANSVDNPKKALPYSLFSPIMVGFVLYSSLSLAFIFCIGGNKFEAGATAPLVGLVSLFSLHIVTTVLFLDAILAPLGTANVYTAMTARILLGLGRDFLPESFFTKLNKNLSPAHCLWFNILVGSCFLFPFPTWQQLVDFLSSVVVFAYLAGPISMIVLRLELPHLPRVFIVWNYKLIGNLGFIACSLLIYWSGFHNLCYLFIAIIILLALYAFFINKESNLFIVLCSNWFILLYLALMIAISYARQQNVALFPLDNILVIIVAFIACQIFIKTKIATQHIHENISRYNEEIGDNLHATAVANS